MDLIDLILSGIMYIRQSNIEVSSIYYGAVGWLIEV